MQVTGLDYTACTVLPLWELFTLPFGPESPSWQAMCDLAGRGDEFVIQGCTLAANPHHSVFTIDFRCDTASARPSLRSTAQPRSGEGNRGVFEN